MTSLIQRQLTTLSLRLGTAGLGFVIKQVLNFGRSRATASAVNKIYDLWSLCSWISRWAHTSSHQSHLLPSDPSEQEALSWLVVVQAELPSDYIRDFRKLLCLVHRPRQCVVQNDGAATSTPQKRPSLRQSRHI